MTQHTTTREIPDTIVGILGQRRIWISFYQICKLLLWRRNLQYMQVYWNESQSYTHWIGGNTKAILSADIIAQILLLTNNVQPIQPEDNAVQARCALLPGHTYKGGMYRLNESILVNAESGDDMEIAKIISIFSTNISGKCYGFIYAALYSQSISDTGESLYHIYSDNPYVEPTSLMKLFLVSAVVRKVMLYLDPEMLHNPIQICSH